MKRTPKDNWVSAQALRDGHLEVAVSPCGQRKAMLTISDYRLLYAVIIPAHEGRSYNYKRYLKDAQSARMFFTRACNQLGLTRML